MIDSFDNSKSLIKLFGVAKTLTVLFYFVYSVLPSVYALLLINFGEVPYFWATLHTEDIVKISMIQIFGWFTLILTIPSSRFIVPKKSIIYLNENIFNSILLAFIVYAVVILLEMINITAGIHDRNTLFEIASILAGETKLGFVFLFTNILVLTLVFKNKKMLYILALTPFVLYDLISMGRIWLYFSLVNSIFIYVLAKQKMPQRAVLYLIIVFFVGMSLLRLGSDILTMDLDSIIIFAFGEAFNTSQSIELAYNSSLSVNLPENFLQMLYEFLPLGIKSFVVDQDLQVINLIDSAKISTYGSDFKMGFGSSWFSHAVIYIGYSWFLILWPAVLSIGLLIGRLVLKSSDYMGMLYLFFYTTAIFMSMRYGLNLSISYPVANMMNSLVLLYFIGAFTSFSIVRSTKSRSTP